MNIFNFLLMSDVNLLLIKAVENPKYFAIVS